MANYKMIAARISPKQPQPAPNSGPLFPVFEVVVSEDGGPIHHLAVDVDAMWESTGVYYEGTEKHAPQGLADAATRLLCVHSTPFRKAMLDVHGWAWAEDEAAQEHPLFK